MKKKIGIVAVVLGALVALLVWTRADAPAENGADPVGGTGGATPQAAQPARRVPRAERAPAARAPRPPKPTLELSDDEDEDEDDARTPEEKALAARIEKALDDESLPDALVCAREALRCGNAEIRQAMVDTLGWFGEKALPELTPFLADPDEDVRDAAMNEWSMAVSEIENEAEKVGVVELAMNVLSDEDALEDISGEYIGVDEKIAVESLVRLIEANGSAAGVAKAKETYEFVTGDEWVSKEAAAKWIAEEYEPGDQ